MVVFIDKFCLGGPGPRVAIKDSIDVEGRVTTCGSAAYEHHPAASQHAEVVANVIEAGGELVGKTTMHELAFGMSGVNAWAGTPTNTHYPEYIPGGSSSGSAVAVANGDADFSIGTDTGGSIRVPAACCGVYGFKPTFGRVSRKGVMPKESELDCVGPMAASAGMIITAMRMMDPSFIKVSGLKVFKLGLVKADVDAGVKSVFEQAIAKLNFELECVELPLMSAAYEAALSLINAEAWNAYGGLLNTGSIGNDVSARLLAAKNVTSEELDAAKQIRSSFDEDVNSAFRNVDFLIMPTLPSFPLKLDDAISGAVDLNISRLVRPFNLSGHPAITIPIQRSGGHPVSIQLIAKKWNDEELCEAAKIIDGVIN
ncbi:amidase [Dasania marina]|uniref:amidase n=1 Tax=Dasania marina TaxID=471499 RepID=UPI000382B0F5|nr:amidase [Dasania marina]